MSPSSAITPQRVLLLGGTSEIGLAIVRRLGAERPLRAMLAGRDEVALQKALGTLGDVPGEIATIDAEELEDHRQALMEAFERFGGFDTVVLAIGLLGGQAGLATPREESLSVMRVNFLGAGSLLLETLLLLRAQGHGSLIVLSSVAAERPRSANAIYGAAKAGLDSLAQGLADSVAGSGVRVLVVRPGFVFTKMTADLEPAPMATSPDAVADAVALALDGRAHTVWVPSRLRWVFAVLRHLPRWIYRRLPL